MILPPNNVVCVENFTIRNLNMSELEKPNKPKPPLMRYIKEGCGVGFCPKCGSSMMKTKLFFGKIKCIHPECGFER